MKRYRENPILTRADIPEIGPRLVDVSSVFNPGAIKFNEKFLLFLRVQNRARETFFLVAESENGKQFEIVPRIVNFEGIEQISEEIYHCYDARITRLGDKNYLMFAMDMKSGCYLGLAQTDDFQFFEFIGIVSEDEARNGVLFPEKINGKFMRLDRPNKIQLRGGPQSGDTICLSESDDLLQWRLVDNVFSGQRYYWDELIGAGPPPVKTKEGWLLIYYGVATHSGSVNIYQAGVILLDLKNPARVISRGRYNIFEPRELYELTGQVPNVIFPSGLIVDKFDAEGFAEPDSSVFIYYGAADTCVGLAFTTIEELILAAFNN